MGLVLGFISVKGGVGKTTMALETAACMANTYGKKVLLVDANFSAPNLGLHLNLDPELTLHDALLGVGLHNAICEKHGFDVVPASIIYKHDVDFLKLSRALSKVRNRYDFVILDSSPHYSEMVPVVNAADMLFVVTTPDIPTLGMSMKAAQYAKHRNTPIHGMIINKIRDNKHELSLNEIEQGMNIPVVARIRDNKNMVESIHRATPMVLLKPNDAVSKEVMRFVSAIVGEPERPRGFFHSFLPFKNLLCKEEVNRELMRDKFYKAQL